MFGINIEYPEKAYHYASRSLRQNDFDCQLCDVCGRTIISDVPKGSDSFVLEGGKKYPDFLYYGGIGLYFIVSEKAMDVLEQNNITGYNNISKVDVYRIKNHQLCKIDEMNYFSLDICGSIDFDLKKMPLKKKNLCQKCGQFNWSRQRLELVETFLDMNSWDGSDLCRIRSAPGFTVCCTRLKEHIENNSLSGVVFRSEKKVFNVFSE